MPRHLVVVEPSPSTVDPADPALLGRLADETGTPATTWEHLLVGSATLARVVGGADDVREAHELASKVDFCGLQARVVRLDDLRAAAALVKEVVSIERNPRSHGAFRVALADGSHTEVTHRDLRALVSGRQNRRGHDELFLALVRDVEPHVLVVRAPGTRLDALGANASSPELAVGELFRVLIDAAPRVAVERALERPGTGTNVAELDDLVAAVAIAAWSSRAAASHAPASEAPAPINLDSIFGLDAPAPAHAAPAQGASLELGAVPRHRDAHAPPAPSAGPVDAPFASPADAPPDSPHGAPHGAPDAGDRPARPRPPRPVKKASPSLGARVNELRADKPLVFYGALAAMVVVVVLAVFGRGTPGVADEKLGKGAAWKSPYGVTFTFESSFDASVGGEHVVGMTVVAHKGDERETFRISGYDATRARTAFGVPFKLTAHDDAKAEWITVEARKPSP